MTLFILTETSAGYALLKAKDKKLLKRDDILEQTESAEGACSLLKLRKFHKFETATEALEEIAAVVDGKVTPALSNLLEPLKEEKKVSLAVADPKLGNAINKLPQFSIAPVSDSQTTDLFRAIRTHLTSLVPGLLPDDVNTMSLGLSHSLSRHKLKFSPEKVDIMIIQAIGLLDDLDKELNTYAMRVKEWYGWHFPEMSKIINDNTAYAKTILKLGFRSNAANSDLAEILPEEIETAIKAAAEVSMGTDVTEDDLTNIQVLAEQVVEFTSYRQELASYLASRMQAIAPNLTALVGDLVGARLIAHAGSLINLAKSPASTIQILGAEKALFRALKTKHDTPKYGLIYNASLVGQATGRNKGKMARMLATKTALSLRVDSLSDWGVQGEGMRVEPTEEEKTAVGIGHRIGLERRLRHLEGKPLGPRAGGVAIGPAGQHAQPQPVKFEIKEARKYNKDADGLGEASAASVGAAMEVDGESKKEKGKLIQDITMTNGDGNGSEEDLEEEDVRKPITNGDAEAEKPEAQRRTEKAKYKAEKARKREEKAQRRAEKEAKRAAKAAKKGQKDKAGKKRKHADEEEDGIEKKKKKKKKSSG